MTLRQLHAPYYFFAVVAVFTHLGCAAYWRFQARRRLARALLIGSTAIGAGVSLLLVLSLAGAALYGRDPGPIQAPFPRTEMILSLEVA
jgi:hypothetical protein